MKDFNFFNENKESKFYRGHVRDYITMYGIPVKYFKRTDFNPDTIFGEDPSALYERDNVFDCKMFTDNATQFDGSDDLFSKFGLVVDNQMNLYVEKDSIENILGAVPLPDDLVYIPMMNRLFEVIKADPKNLFFLFGNLMTYKITLKLAEYSQEQLDTGYESIDALEGQNVTHDALKDNISTTLSQTVIDFSERDPFGDLT